MGKRFRYLHKEQFGIRKLTIGICSCLIGLGLVYSSPATVEAEAVQPTQATESFLTTADTTLSTDVAVETVSTAYASTSIPASDTSNSNNNPSLSAPIAAVVSSDTEPAATTNQDQQAGGQVTAIYLDVDGNSIQDDVIVQPAGTPVGTPYTAEKPDPLRNDAGLLYKLVGVPEHASGLVDEYDSIIAFFYEPILGGAVNLRYVTDTDIVLHEETLLPENTQVGTAYTSQQDDLTDADGFVWTYSQLEASSAPASGRVTPEMQQIIYLYTAKAGEQVTVNYRDDKGNMVLEDVVVQPAGVQVGTPYNASQLQRDVIERDGKKYQLITTPNNVTGYVSAQEIVVTYVYQLLSEQKTAAKQADSQTIEENTPSTTALLGYQKYQEESLANPISKAKTATMSAERLPETGSDSFGWLSCLGLVWISGIVFFKKKENS